MTKLKTLLISMTLGAGISQAATTVFSDTFSDGDRTDGADLDDIQWYAGRNNVALSVGADAGIGTGDALLVNSSTTFSRVVGLFGSAVTIGVGETLRLSFDMRFQTTPGTGSGLLRIGIFNNGGTAITGDEDPGANQNNHFGYGFSTNPGAVLAGGTTVTTEEAGNSILGGSNPGGFSSTGSAGASIEWGTTVHNGVFSITRLADGSMDLSARIDGGTAATANIAAPINSSYTFHEVAFGQGNMNIDFALDNVELSIVPEPSTSLVLALGALCFLRRRRLP
ncbi:PEP-CTERM sorting domain-containing protein [Akkermansiaceae bacterium]|nr:PEP-CTERM sorting domain-containing protein [Akkermansiaceae bacterium]